MPDEFVCPISCEIMREPVTTVAGNTYEKEHIMAWFRTHQTDPLTNARMSSKRLVPNNSLRSQIQTWLQVNPTQTKRLIDSGEIDSDDIDSSDDSDDSDSDSD